jgi:acetyltransferase-like isoleucine patch superfamily enzyme
MEKKTQPNTIPESIFSLQAAQMALDAPWIAANEITRLLGVPLAWLNFSLSGIQIGRGWRCYGLPIVQKHRRSTLTIGVQASFRSSLRSNPLVPNHPCMLSTRRAGAVLRIGDHFGMTGGVIVCEQSIQIGNRVLIGANSIITDTDFHPLDSLRRINQPLDGETAPVVIEDDVFVGMQSLILKGVRIGARSVIGAGSVVTRDIPADVIAAGNPARVIRDLAAAD